MTTTHMTPGQAEDAVLQLTYDIVDIARAGLGVSEGEATRMASAIVRGLGLFTWEAGSTELDDDETCFATAGGAWVLTAAGPDAVRALWQAEVSAMQQTRFLSADFSMSATSVAGGAKVTFIVALVGATNGDSVYVTPDRELPAAVSTVGVVTQPGTVTVSVRNVSASTNTLTPGTWQVLVIKP